MSVEKTVFTVTVYHDAPIENMELLDIVEEITTGDWYGEVSRTRPVVVPQDEIPEFFNSVDYLEVE